MINLIPMAGRGNRFFQDYYRVPKPLVTVMGSPMFITALRSFPPADKYVFLYLEEHLARYSIEPVIRSHYPQSSIIPVPEVTEGQASTCLLAEPLLNPDEGLFIASCDYQTIFDHDRYNALISDPDVDVIVWTFRLGSITKAPPDAYAFCRVKGDQVTEIVEKQIISNNPSEDPAVVGSFWYRSASLFVRGAKEMIDLNIRVNGEFYVGTSINQLINAGFRVVTFEVDSFISFGNPIELRHFEYWQEYFHELADHPYKMGHRRLGLEP
jgi:hypothetical protein